MPINTSYMPTDGLCYDPSEPKYWDEAALDKEIHRVFEVCHGCRMCFKFCDSFPDLFRFVDEVHDGDVGALTRAEVGQVMDACFQCKLCEVECPYTPRDGHEFQLDFPKLVHRHKAIQGRKHGFKLRDRVFGDPDFTGRMARASLGLANALNRVKAHRWLMEKALGIHRDKQLPEFSGTTFERWAKQVGKLVAQPSPGAEAVLFQTCYVQNNEPQIGRDCVEVMERNQVRMDCCGGLGCCGMPAWEHGDLDALRAQARGVLDKLMPWVERGASVVALSPTCSMMMRREWPELLEGPDRERARRLSERVVEAAELLWSIRGEPRFDVSFKSSPGERVAYHAPCHLRAQARGFKGRDILKKIPGVQPRLVTECCGHDGTYAMTVEGFEPSARIGRKAFDGMKAQEAEIWATDCPLAAIQFEQHAGVRALHPMTILARAYRADGFANKL
ncbi:MAG TPA: heterodisulfide reductase-related iron-sulfur binding cluster [Myxococcota bacterium]|nr:heterodisulfide reductase-related iron-sulfur binding cluster [Myxococcota bacterium]